MNRRQSIPTFTLGLVTGIGTQASAQGQPKTTAPEGVAIVVPFVSAPEKNPDEILKAMNNVVAVIRVQPGLIR